MPWATFRQCLQMLGLMASLLAIMPLGGLHMRERQRWVTSLNLCQKRHIRVTTDCAAALTPLEKSHNQEGGDYACLIGWRATHEGRVNQYLKTGII